MTTSKTGGLANVLTIGVGCRVMLRRNLDASNGLVNGAMGTVSHFNFEADGKTIANVVVNFDDCGLKCIEKCTSDFQVSLGHFYKRSQFPLLLCYAMTIHKSQGLTLPCVYVDLESGMHTTSMAYVALSRTRKLEHLNIIKFDPSQFKCDEICVKEYDRLRNKFNVKHPNLPLLDSMPEPNVLPENIVLTKQIYCAGIQLPNDNEMANPCLLSNNVTKQYINHNRALTFSNENNNCYANALVQTILASPVFTLILQQLRIFLPSQTQLLIEFYKLSLMNDNPPGDKVSVEKFKIALYGKPTSERHSSYKMLSKLLDNFPNHCNLWNINITVDKIYECCGAKISDVQNHHTLTLCVSDVENDGIVEWADLANVITNSTSTLIGTCPSERCNGSEMMSFIQYQNDDGIVDNENGDYRENSNCEQRSCKIIQKRQITQSSESTLLFVDIPNEYDGEHMDITLVNLPADNQFVFSAFPDNLYRLVGIVCHSIGHYYAYVLKFGDWYIVDCVKKPHVKQVLTTKLFEKISNVTLLIYEKI